MNIPGVSLPRRVVVAAVWELSFQDAEKPKIVKTQITKGMILLHVITITFELLQGIIYTMVKYATTLIN